MDETKSYEVYIDGVRLRAVQITSGPMAKMIYVEQWHEPVIVYCKAKPGRPHYHVRRGYWRVVPELNAFGHVNKVQQEVIAHAKRAWGGMTDPPSLLACAQLSFKVAGYTLSQWIATRRT